MASNELDSFISGLEKTSGASTSGGANPKQEKGQYFVDQNTGQYYFQSGDGEAMAIVPSDEAEANTNPTNSGPSTSDNQVNKWLMMPLTQALNQSLANRTRLAKLLRYVIIDYKIHKVEKIWEDSLDWFPSS